MGITDFTRILGRSSDRATYLLAVTLLTGFVLWLITRLALRAFRNLPPGPKGLPFIGDVVHITDQDWLTAPERLTDYGDTPYLQCFQKCVHVRFRRNDVYQRARKWRPCHQQPARRRRFAR